MIPYYNPHFRLRDLFLAAFQFNAQKKIIRFFNNYTGKKYILFTSSCRAALYIAYQSLNKKGWVITSPLTCQSAIDPIIWSQNVPVFVDIDLETLNINPQNIENAILQDVIAIQVINHGGIRVEGEQFLKINNLDKLKIIEDCAQSFGNFNKKTINTFRSDVSCYSLIKTGYGLGGGILATNDEDLYARALSIQNSFPGYPIKVIIYRIIKQLFESNRNFPVFEKLYQRLISLRNSSDDIGINTEGSKQTFLKKPPLLYKRYFAARISFMQYLQCSRQKKGMIFIDKLFKRNLMLNYSSRSVTNSSFTKLFLYHPKFDSDKFIPYLLSKGVEAKHLEQKAEARVQPQFDISEIKNYSIGIEGCKNYFAVHNHLISLPLTEEMEAEKMDEMILIIDKYTANG
jgi:hypothetical protein